MSPTIWHLRPDGWWREQVNGLVGPYSPDDIKGETLYTPLAPAWTNPMRVRRDDSAYFPNEPLIHELDLRTSKEDR